MRPEAGIADWACDWNSDTEKTGVELHFDRTDDLDPDEGERATVAGHDALVAPREEGDDTCVVRTAYREYDSPSGGRHLELFKLRFVGSGSADELCATARSLAAAAVRKLPKG
ncbi:hypothetical protein NKH77_30485 [Streptomyces sp. M19]